MKSFLGFFTLTSFKGFPAYFSAYIRLLTPAFIFSLLLAIASCNKDKDKDPANPTKDPVNPTDNSGWGSAINLDIFGKVEDENGMPVTGATVKAGSNSVSTDENGIFILKNAPALSSLGYVQVEKVGYFTGSRSFLPTQGVANLRIKLLTKQQTGIISSSSGGTVSHSSGVELMLEPGSVSKNGAPYSGNVKVFLQGIDPTTTDYESRMPGDLIAMDGNQAQGLKSFAMMAAELQDDAGQELVVAAGKKAHVKFPIPAGLQASAADSIDLWSFDQEKGYWKKEGRAGKEGNFYHALVGHFSFWNCDARFPLIELKGRIMSNGLPLANATVTINSTIGGSRSIVTNADGRFGGSVPKDQGLNIVVTYTCGSGNAQVYNQNIGPFSTNTQLPDVSVSIPSQRIISGKVSGCFNASISGTYILVGNQAYLTDANSNYSFTSCQNSLTLTAYGSNPFVKGNSQTISPSSGSNTVNLQVCAGTIGIQAIDIDNNLYTTVTIGTQVWMKENLKTSKYRNGIPIPTNLDSTAWAGATNGAYSIANNDQANNVVYGKLYNWYAVTNPNGLCPVGWHVPSDAEWKTLESYLGMPASELDGLSDTRGSAQNVGGKLKAVSNLWFSPTGATDESGFSALPGGARYGTYYSEVGYSGAWWSSTESTSGNAWSRSLYSGGSSSRFSNNKQYGFSVRCLRD